MLGRSFVYVLNRFDVFYQLQLSRDNTCSKSQVKTSVRSFFHCTSTYTSSITSLQCVHSVIINSYKILNLYKELFDSLLDHKAWMRNQMLYCGEASQEGSLKRLRFYHTVPTEVGTGEYGSSLSLKQKGLRTSPEFMSWNLWEELNTKMQSSKKIELQACCIKKMKILYRCNKATKDGFSDHNIYIIKWFDKKNKATEEISPKVYTNNLEIPSLLFLLFST